jgi:tRNA dimethylallyltransferase
MATQRVIVIVGSTASGKSAFAVTLARAIGGEIVSADSRQVYRGLDIGTGKMTKREMRGVPHHLIDVVSPKRVFTADDFVKRGRKAIQDIVRRGKVPIIAGGTGFYIDALLGTITLPNVPPNKVLRANLAHHTTAELFSLLLKKDPERARTIDKDNPVRLIRAIEIAEVLGATPSPEGTSLYDVCWIGIDVPHEELKEKIEERLTRRIQRGMLREASRLHAGDLSWKRMEALGLEYRYMARLLQKKMTKLDFIRELTSEIVHYAKRQRTYWKRNKDIQWFAPTELPRAEGVITKFLSTTARAHPNGRPR